MKIKVIVPADDRLVSIRDNHRLFLELVERRKVKLFNSLSDVQPNTKTELTKGQRCSFVNDYGVCFQGFTIMGFGVPDEYGNCVYIDKDSYWCPIKPESLILE